MDLITRLGSEDHDVYQQVQQENYARYWSFLQTVIEAFTKLPSKGPWISHDLIQAINLHATASLHPRAGQYRNIPVHVANRNEDGIEEIVYRPPDAERVPLLMGQFVDSINTDWNTLSPILAASVSLWRINAIQPFTNGNGRTARAICYYILCVKSGGPISGSTNLIELLRTEPHRQHYLAGLREADNGELGNLIQLIGKLVDIQLNS